MRLGPLVVRGDQFQHLGFPLARRLIVVHLQLPDGDPGVDLGGRRSSQALGLLKMSFRFRESSLPDRCLATLNFSIDSTAVRGPDLGNGTRHGEQEHQNAAG